MEPTGTSPSTATLAAAPPEPPDAPAAAPVQVAAPRDDAAPARPREDADPVGWRASFAYCLRVYLAVRVGLSLLGLLAVGLVPSQGAVQVPGYQLQDPSEGWHALFTAWERWDALWYLRIAQSGYADDDGSAAFFPLYPMLTRGVAQVLGDRWLLAAYVVSNVALVAALVLLHRLTALEFSEVAARRSVLYLCLFPTALFLFAPYTESLFLALTLGCLYAARRQAWPVAAALGATASLCRSTGLLLALPLAVEAGLQWWRDDRAGRRRAAALVGRLAAAGAPVLGIGAYLLFWRSRGEWDRPLSLQQSYWGKEASWPWETLWVGVREGTSGLGRYAGGYTTVDVLLTLVVVAAGIWVAVRVRPTYAVYFWVSVAFPMLYALPGRPLASMPRYLLVVFPVYWAFARLAERRGAHDLVVGASALGLGLLSVLYCTWHLLY